jgi:hypothetical protein
MNGNTQRELRFSCIGIDVSIQCDDFQHAELLRWNFSAMKPTVESPSRLAYRLRSAPGELGYTISRADSDYNQAFENSDDLIRLLEGDLVVQLQLLRDDLLFLHAAVVGLNGEAHLLVGKSGAGKSTTCWGLLHHGFSYVSDELAPIILARNRITPYPHALCMKKAPPEDYPIPSSACATGRGFHIPISAMPGNAIESDLPIRTIFFIQYHPKKLTSVIAPIGHSEAATCLYPNILNALAHQNEGLAAALRVTENTNCYRLEAGFLRSTCEMISSVVSKQSI